MTDDWYPSRYGPEDVRGAGNELTADRTKAALQIPTRGEVIPLAPILGSQNEVMEPRLYHQIVLTHGRTTDGSIGFEEHISATMHIGCHLDSLGHVGIGDRFYNGNHFDDVFGVRGLKKLGVENAPPWVSRGVCLDIPAVRDVDALPDGSAIAPDELEAACQRQNLQIRPGDVVLLHTGWGRLRGTDPVRYGGCEPGPGLDAARWLTDRRVSLVGADNWALEVIPPETTITSEVHQYLLAQHGTYIVENIDTQALVSRGIGEHLFVMTPLRVQGATGSMVAPAAVV